MKSKLLLVMLLFASTIVFAQDHKKEIENQFKTYATALVNKDFNKSLTYAPDELFTIYPKEQLLAQMEQAFNNADVEVFFEEPKLLNVGEKEQIEGKYYARLRYASTTKMKFHVVDRVEDAEARQVLHETTRNTFKKDIKEGKAKYDEKTSTISIHSEKEIYAISADGKSDWRFVSIEKNQKATLKKILPKQLIKKINFSKS